MQKYFFRRLHVSWLIGMLSLGVIIGVAVAPSVSSELFSTFSWIIIAFILLTLSIWKKYVILVPIIVLAGMMIGLWRGSTTYSMVKIAENLSGKLATVEGKISEDPGVDKRGRLVIRLSNIKVDNHQVAGSAWVAVKSKTVIQRSDQLTISGKLSDGFGTFVFSLYDPIIKAVNRPQPGDVALGVRNWFSDAIRVSIAEPEASLGSGYLLGQRRDLPNELNTSLQLAGLTHVVVASGYNLTILIRLARRGLSKISKFLAFFASGSLILGFIAVTGLSPSMSRAGLVAGLALLAWYYGRRFHPVFLILFVAAVSLLIHPSYVWGDVGWLLSFAAFAGVMVLAPLLQAYYFGEKKPGMLRQVVGETIAATICTLPIVLYAFGYFSNIAIVANLMVVPLVPLAMLLTFFGGIGSLILPGFGTILGYPAQLLLSYMVNVANYFARLPWAISEVTISGVYVIGMYVFIGIGAFYLWHSTKLRLSDQSIIE